MKQCGEFVTSYNKFGAIVFSSFCYYKINIKARKNKVSQNILLAF